MGPSRKAVPHGVRQLAKCVNYVSLLGGGGRNSPKWARASLFTKVLDHTQRRNTVDRTPLDE